MCRKPIKQIIKLFIDGNISCPICLSNDKETFITTNCGHVFHEKCIMPFHNKYNKLLDCNTLYCGFCVAGHCKYKAINDDLENIKLCVKNNAEILLNIVKPHHFDKKEKDNNIDAVMKMMMWSETTAQPPNLKLIIWRKITELLNHLHNDFISIIRIICIIRIIRIICIIRIIRIICIIRIIRIICIICITNFNTKSTNTYTLLILFN
jgi:hypothetical protein